MESMKEKKAGDTETEKKRGKKEGRRENGRGRRRGMEVRE